MLELLHRTFERLNRSNVVKQLGSEIASLKK